MTLYGIECYRMTANAVKFIWMLMIPQQYNGNTIAAGDCQFSKVDFDKNKILPLNVPGSVRMSSLYRQN